MPAVDQRGEGRLGSGARLRRPALLAREHAEGKLAGKRPVVVAFPVRRLAHRSRQSLSFARPRLIQLFIVPSGTPVRPASAS